jgi:hypothetical protein
MKRFIFLISSLVLFLTAYGAGTTPSTGAKIHDETVEGIATLYNDGKAAVSTVYSDGKDLVETLYPEVRDVLISIAKALGCAVEHVYKVLVMQYVVKGVQQLFIFLVGLTILIFGLIFFSRYVKSKQSLTWRILPSLVLIITSIILFWNVNYETMFMGLINPEFGALNYILEYTKSIIH